MASALNLCAWQSIRIQEPTVLVGDLGVNRLLSKAQLEFDNFSIRCEVGLGYCGALILVGAAPEFV